MTELSSPRQPISSAKVRSNFLLNEAKSSKGRLIFYTGVLLGCIGLIATVVKLYPTLFTRYSKNTLIKERIEFIKSGNDIIGMNGKKYSVFRIEFNEKLYRHIKFYKNYNSLSRTDFINQHIVDLPVPDSDRVFASPRDLFAITAAMYDVKDNMPPGLVISEGQVLKGINVNSETGNFFSKPNGFIYINETNVDILPTEKFDNNVAYKFALQSGPILVQNGFINSNLTPINRSYYKRCAVGIAFKNGKKELIFVASKDNVSLYELATFFRDDLKCISALHLESGNFPVIYFPGSTYPQNGNPIKNYLIIR